MAIYEFSMVSWQTPSGVDTAICNRAKILAEKGYDVKVVLPTYPNLRDLNLYLNLGLKFDKIINVYASLSGIENLEPKIKYSDMLLEIDKALGGIKVEYIGNSIHIKKDEHRAATVILMPNTEAVYAVEYFNKKNYLMRRDYYADVLYTSEFYMTVEKKSGKEAELKERIFYTRDGSMSYIQNFIADKEYNIFPDGNCYNAAELFSLFIERLNLTKKDFVIIDRPRRIFPTRALFECYKKTNIVAVVHSEHFFEKGVSVEGWYLNAEYWYWCKYSKYIHTMIVGTEEQKNSLKDILEKYGWNIPEIRVIPPVCIDKIQFPALEREKKSLICVSRLNGRKKIDWTIGAVIKAHKYDPEISLDIYGRGSKEYTDYLEGIIREHDASEYISLKGHADVSEIYKNYEVYLTTSLWETFGITLLEAVASGLALIGLDVKYGNHLFIEEGKNGFLVPYNPEHMFEECPMEIDELAKKIVEVFSDDKRLEAFRKRSYQIAEKYMSHHVNQKWYDLIEEKIEKPERKM